MTLKAGKRLEEIYMIRRVIQIDEDKCNGCGACANACHEGAIGTVSYTHLDVYKRQKMWCVSEGPA